MSAKASGVEGREIKRYEMNLKTLRRSIAYGTLLLRNSKVPPGSLSTNYLQMSMVFIPFFHVRIATSLLLSLVAFFCLILLLYHTSIGAFFLSARPGTLYNIQTIINAIQELLQTVTNCYNFFLDFRVKSFFQLLHIVTIAWSVLSIMVAMVQMTMILPR